MAETKGVKETGGDKKLPNAGLTEVGQIAVTVEDVGRATAFYRDVLGVPFLFDAPGPGVLRPRWSTPDAEPAGGRGAIRVAAVLSGS